MCNKLGLFPSPLWGGARGGGRCDGAVNNLKHAIDVSEHVVIPEAENAIALRFEKFSSLRVPARLVPAVNFDDELRGMIGKIYDVGTQPDLPSEMGLRDREAMPQMPPQFPLSFGRRGPHCASASAIGSIE